MHTLKYDGDTLYITEGAFDALSIDQAGHPVLATMGGYFGKKAMPLVISICKRFKNIVLAFDNDNGGQAFTKDFASALIDARLRFQVALIPKPHKDVSDYYTAGGQIAYLPTEDGLVHLARKITDVEELKTFGSRVSRYVDTVDIATILSNADNFSAEQIKALKKVITSAPPEKTIAEEIMEKTNLLYVDGDGFYIWDRLTWKKVSDVIIRQYALYAYGNYATAQRCNAVCSLLKAMAAKDVDFDRKPVLTFTNGTLELETGTFRDADPADYCAMRMTYPYVREEKCPHWEAFIREVTDGKERSIRMLQSIAGYVLFPDCRFQKIFALIGKGGNGKSVYSASARW